MSEKEKLEQIGALVEEISHLKGKLAHINEKLNRAQQSYQYAGPNFIQIFLNGDQLGTRTQRPGPPNLLEGLLDSHQLLEALRERDKLNEEIKVLDERLKPLAPHLFQH